MLQETDNARRTPPTPLAGDFIAYLEQMEPYAEATKELSRMAAEARANHAAGNVYTLEEMLERLALGTRANIA